MKSTDLSQYLKALGLKKTPIRLHILEVLFSTQHPLNIEDIKQYLTTKKIAADEVTVYRAVNALVDKAFVHEICFHDGKSRYELASRNHHHHIICNSCGSVAELADNLVCLKEGIEEQIAKKHNYTGVSHSLEFFGICDRCAKK